MIEHFFTAPYVTVFAFVPPVLHDEVLKPPSAERRWRRRRRRTGAGILKKGSESSKGSEGSEGKVSPCGR